MRSGVQAADSFCRFHDVALEDLDRFPDAIGDIHRGHYQGLIIRGVYSPSAAEELARRIELGHARFDAMRWQKQETGTRYSTAFGRPFMVDTDQTIYLAAAARFRESCRILFEGMPDFEERMLKVFGSLSGGREVGLPRAPNGAEYTPATIRLLLPDCQIPVHVGNEFIRYPQARQLAICADISCQFSYFLTLRPAEAGGELTVFSLQWSDIEDVRKQRSTGLEANEFAELVDDLISRSESVSYKPDAGDLIVFDGGRYFHQVTRIEGTHNRITIGGFLVFSADHGSIYYWS